MNEDNPLLFRFHSGTLDDSMATIIKIESHDHLITLIKDAWDVNPTEITIKPYIYDDRIKWDTHLVLVHLGNISYPIGYLNKNPEWSLTDYE